MGQGEAGLVHDLVAVHQQVEVDRSRAKALATDAPEALLDVEQAREELLRRQLGRYLGYPVQKGALVDGTDRLGLTQLRDRNDLDSVLRGEELERLAQMTLTVTEI